MVSLIHKEKHFCSGTYISSNWVLTSAHCIKIRLVRETKVIMGTDTVNAGGETREIKRAIQHPLKAPIKVGATESNASTEALNNIGLIKLTEPFDLGKTISTIGILGERNKFEGTQVQIAGYGKLCAKETDSAKLGVLEFKVMQEDDYVIYPEWELASWTDEEDVCRGDSGGPIIFESKVIGVVVCGFNCGPKKTVLLNTFLKLHPHLKWINQKLTSQQGKSASVRNLLIITSLLLIVIPFGLM